ncbi:PilN domain-containing protein [Halalkalibacterium ligniniphilum]|uniref:PilN domain-containing protein n=1 Tax=Halalkalibacterium ligniniphilum TaxID=1134413 RepID=UPI000345AFED|nr:hypothetical protein [Halalkalibacterium ligniniphilum]
MALEINLLPEKERRDFTTLFLILIILVFLTVLGSMMYVFIGSLNAKNAELEQQIVANQQMLSERTAQQTIGEAGTTAELQHSIHVLEQHMVPVTPVLDSLVSLLPERGFFLDLRYERYGQLELKVQFDQLAEVAYYQKQLQTSPIVLAASLAAIHTTEISLDEEEGEQNPLPRYQGDFTIQLDMKQIQEETSEHS